jgi:CheY-like chemotaxis protein
MGKPKPSGKAFADRVRDDAEIDAILNRLDEADESSKAERRRTRRYSYRAKDATVHFQDELRGEWVPCRVRTRNISEGGLSLLHRAFVYPNTPCMVQLITRYGAWTDIKARVAFCRYIDNGIHEVGVRFDVAIDPSMFAPAADHMRVLLAEDDPSSSRLATFFLEQSNVEVEHAENGHVAVEKAIAQHYDLILMDMEMPVMDGFAATSELRGQGYAGLIVAITALSRPEDRKRCLEAGCDRHLPKPYSRADMSKLLETIRGEPLFSSLCADPDMTQLIDAFVAELPARRTAIVAVLAAEDAKRLEQLVRTLKGEGGGYGFEPISELADKIETALREGASLAALLDLFTKARPASQPARQTDRKAGRK